jgi:glycosyltransferase involved in cell wall biosynthesis
MPEVSVVVPTMNEAKSINNCITTIFGVFATRHIVGEVVLSDNSSDRTPDIACSLGARVVVSPILGYGHALLYGINHAQGKYIVLGDADRSYDFSIIPELIEPLIKGEADLVIGSRLKGDIHKGAMPILHRYIGNPLITYILNKKLGTHITDAHSGIRAFTKEMWDKIDTTLIPEDFCSEMLKQFVINKAKIVEIPIDYHPRDGNVKAGTVLHGYRCFKFLLVHVVMDK